MSLINDALRRAQEQKSRQAQKPLAVETPAPPVPADEPAVLSSSPAPRRSTNRVVVLVAATLLAGGAVVAWQMLGAGSGGSTPQAARAADAKPATPIAPAAAVFTIGSTDCAEIAPNDLNGPAPRSSPEYAPRAQEIAPVPPALQPAPKSDDQALTPVSEMAPPPSAPAATKTYVVKKGNTLINIARTELGNERRVKEIQNLNPGLDPAKLKIGQEILVPAK